jgi:putative ABC transport system permease protein
MARASLRTREMAVRTALGAGRGRLVRQLMIEVLLLALAGSTLGLLLNHAGMQWFLSAIAVNPPPFWVTFDLDYRVMLFVILTTLVACVLAGLAPALQASRTNVSEILKDESRGTTGFRMGRFIAGLVVAEVALSCGLLIGAGLMIKSVVQLKTIDLPFTRKNIFTARINLPPSRYPAIENRIQFYDRLLPMLEAIPGVEGATLSDGLPASGNGALNFEVEGKRYEREEDYPIAREGIVTPGYFRTFRTEVLRGREFLHSDRQGSLPVAVVNQTFVRTFFPDGDVLGRRIRKGRNDASMQWLTVVGVVPDMLMEGIGNNNASPAGFYIPIAQSNVANFVSIAIRTQGPPMEQTPEIRAAVAALDPDLAIFQILSLDGVIARQTWFYSVFGSLFVAFGLAALFLAVVGLYSVMSFAVARRTPEIGIRMALGAQPGQLIGLIMRKGVFQVALGMVFGLGLATLAANPLQTVLFRVDVRDPAVFLTVLTALAAAGLLACLVPARRVNRIDPMVALTHD